MKKKSLVVLLILLVLCLCLGVSFAIWQFSDKQNTFDTLGTKCFELTMTNASSGIHLDKISPISDEEGKKDDGYTFTITNTCNTNAAYQVNLEEFALDVKRLSNKYIKISLNDSNGKVLNTYEEVTKTLDNADTSHKLTSGSLKPDESVTYNLKLWMDEETPAIDEVMNAAFESKVTVIANYKEDVTNKIETTIVTKNENFSKEKETIDVTVTSELYDIIEVSDDGVTYNPVDVKGKSVTITRTFNREGTHKIYFKDEMGNVKEETIETTKLDQTVPSVEITPTDNQETIRLSIKLADTKSGLVGYKITEDSSVPTEWNTLSTNEEIVEFTVTENKTYYVWVKDSVGNTTYEAYSVSTIDTTAPTLEIKNTLTTWGEKDTILVTATDDLIGLSGVSISTVKNEYHWELIENSPLEYNHTFEVSDNGTYYISVKDAYHHITTKSIVIDKIDTIAPVLSEITNSSNGEWTTESITLSWTITEEESGIDKVEYSLDNTTWNPLLESEWTGLSRNNDRNDTVYIRVTDKAGHVSEVKSTNLRIDTAVPSITNVTGNPTDWTNSDVTLTINGASDTLSGLAETPYSFDNGVTWQTESTKVYTENTNDIVIKVKDKLGNVYTHESISVTKIDKTAPSVTDVTGNPADWTKNDVTLTINGASDTLSGLAESPYSFDNGVTWQVENTKVYTENTNDIVIKVKDKLGNVYTHESISITKIDKTIPNISSLTTTTEWDIKNTVTAVVQDNDSGIVGYAWSTSSDTPTTFIEVTYTKEEQTYTNDYTTNSVVYFFAKDAAGNITSKSITVNKVDTEIPVAKINSSVLYQDITINASESSDAQSGISKYYFSKDGGTTWVSSSTSSYTFTGLSNGEYTLALKVEDNVGRFSQTVTTHATVHISIFMEASARTYENSAFLAYADSSTKLVFQPTKAPLTDYVASFDESKDQDESIMSYVVIDPEYGEGTFQIYVQFEDKAYFPPDSSSFFSNRVFDEYYSTYFESIEGLEYLDTSNVTNMSWMFAGMMGDVNLNLSNFDTSNVTDMSYMFAYSGYLTSLDLSYFNTFNVIDMSGMFYESNCLTNLNLSNLDTSKVINMSEMFYNCYSLSSLDVSDFDTSNVINMSSMFNQSGVTALDLSSFDTSKVTDMSSMFYYCSSLSSLDVSGFDTSNVTNMSSMFEGCSSITSLDLSSFDTSNVTNMSLMFFYCRILTSLDLSSFNTSKVTNMYHMFASMSSLVNLNLNNFNTSNVTNMHAMFYNSRSITNLDLSNFNTISVTDMGAMFKNCDSLTSLNLSNFDTSNVSKTDEMFSSSLKLTSIIYGSKFIRKSGSTVNQMYLNCPANKPTDASWNGAF